MLTGCILVPLFFLIWTFFLRTASVAFARLGESRSMAVVQKHPGRFFYYPFHRFFFKRGKFELLLLATRFGENLGRLGYAGVSFYCFVVLGLVVGFSWVGVLLFLLLFVIFGLLLGDFLPQLWGERSPEKALSISAIVASFFLYLSFPLTFVYLKAAQTSYMRKKEESGGDPIEEMKETIVEILQRADVKGKLNSVDKKLIDSVIKFKDRIVREVMVPRVDLFCLPDTMSVREAARLLAEEGYSRIPVYKETVDNIVGVLMFKDILELYMDCEAGKKEKAALDATIDTIVKKAFYTPETKKVSHLLQEFRTKQMHMAIVVDEYGGTEGVVTIEDILEEIVGDIADEYDSDEETLYTAQPGGGSWIVDARMSIIDAEEIFGIEVPQEGDYDTIGGYIFHRVGSIPQKGLKIHHEDFDLEILSSTERSIEKIRITRRPKQLGT